MLSVIRQLQILLVGDVCQQRMVGYRAQDAEGGVDGGGGGDGGGIGGGDGGDGGCVVIGGGGGENHH